MFSVVSSNVPFVARRKRKVAMISKICSFGIWMMNNRHICIICAIAIVLSALWQIIFDKDEGISPVIKQTIFSCSLCLLILWEMCFWNDTLMLKLLPVYMFVGVWLISCLFRFVSMVEAKMLKYVTEILVIFTIAILVS